MYGYIYMYRYSMPIPGCKLTWTIHCSPSLRTLLAQPALIHPYSAYDSSQRVCNPSFPSP